MHTAQFARLVRAILVPALLCLLVGIVIYGQQKPVIKQVPPAPTSPSSGSEMFKEYCAVCHGLTGKGDGPAIPALKMSPGDLRTLASRNGGKFPELKVYRVITGEDSVASHGTKDMPMWGQVFRDMSRGDDAVIKMRLTNLTRYIESIQMK
jgi:mono/diheme cytochrome c family protein